MLMPFGKYKDEPLEDVPTSYIQWLLETSDTLSTALTNELEAQLAMREGRGYVRKKEV